MGITIITAHLLLEEGHVRPFGGSVLQLGRQDIHFGANDLAKVAHQHAFELRIGAALPAVLDDVDFFRALKFDDVCSLDLSGYQHATLVGDLNLPIKSEQHGLYDCVVDFGTLEHVFHLPNALANIHSLLKVGGRVIHLLPTSNHVDHGFYSFSPVLFHDYYTLNRYRIEQLYFLRFFGDMFYGTYNVYRYEPSATFHELGSMHIFDRGAAAVWVVATKLDDSIGGRIPNQYHYREHAWKPSLENSGDLSRRWLGREKDALKVSPALKWIFQIPELFYSQMDRSAGSAST